MSSKEKRVVYSSLKPIEVTPVYDTYWKFAYERQKVFFNRARLKPFPYTSDEIINKYKFTNVYRSCDRVSQYLIRDVIYSKNRKKSDTFLRIILFKLFNKIGTWQLLEEKFGEINEKSFCVESFGKFLSAEMNSGRILYSNAYMMASGSKEFKVTRKHQAHLALVAMMMDDDLPSKVAKTRHMREGYELLLPYPLIGSFLAYQYITDVNYSTLTDYSESEFTTPGPGAKDGIRKCFSNTAGLTETEIIKIMCDRQEHEFNRLGLDFEYLGKRRLQYIDIQNIFCEVDKYSRAAHPDIKGISGRTRIKQLFSPNDEQIKYCFPPKWNINFEDVL